MEKESERGKPIESQGVGSVTDPLRYADNYRPTDSYMQMGMAGLQELSGSGVENGRGMVWKRETEWMGRGKYYWAPSQ
jgi:hypothetical protein